jgi:hypothetical protein
MTFSPPSPQLYAQLNFIIYHLFILKHNMKKKKEYFKFSGESTRKSLQKRPVQNAVEALSRITIMLNKS